VDGHHDSAPIASHIAHGRHDSRRGTRIQACASQYHVKFNTKAALNSCNDCTIC
jgi:hypothetical protein